MDIEALKARWSQARLFDIEFRGATFHFHLPNGYEIRRVAREVKNVAENDDDAWLLELFRRSLQGWDGFKRSLVGWYEAPEGILIAVANEHASIPDLIPFDRELAVAWAQEDREVWNALVDPLIERVIAKRAAKEDAEKN